MQKDTLMTDSYPDNVQITMRQYQWRRIVDALDNWIKHVDGLPDDAFDEDTMSDLYNDTALLGILKESIDKTLKDTVSQDKQPVV